MTTDPNTTPAEPAGETGVEQTPTVERGVGRELLNVAEGVVGTGVAAGIAATAKAVVAKVQGGPADDGGQADGGSD